MKISVTPESLKGPQPIPSGLYKATISGSNTRTSRAGNMVLNLEATVNSDSPDESVKTMGRKVFIGLTLTVEAIGMVARDYKGITGEELPLGDFEIDELASIITSNCMNKAVMVQIECKASPTDPERFFSNVVKIQPAEG